jgi:hypothetical protein
MTRILLPLLILSTAMLGYLLVVPIVAEWFREYRVRRYLDRWAEDL